MADEKKERAELPQATFGDYAHAGIKGLISAVPIAGGLAAEIFGTVIAPPLSRRKDEWLEQLADALVVLRDQGKIDFDELSKNEEFLSAVLEASSSAIRTHREEKRSALRNAVLNVATNRHNGEDEAALFLNYIDSLTAGHLRVLKYFQNPTGAYRLAGKEPFFPSIGGTPGDALTRLMPEFNNSEVLRRIVSDLFTRGLINADTALIHTMVTGASVFANRTTRHGDAFLTFIDKPA